MSKLFCSIAEYHCDNVHCDRHISKASGTWVNQADLSHGCPDFKKGKPKNKRVIL